MTSPLSLTTGKQEPAFSSAPHASDGWSVGTTESDSTLGGPASPCVATDPCPGLQSILERPFRSQGLDFSCTSVVEHLPNVREALASTLTL